MIRIVFFLFLLLGPSLAAQGDRRLELEEAYASKLAAPFATKTPWVKHIATAKLRAAEDDKLIFAWFTRSYDDCEPAELFERGPLVSPWWAELRKRFVPYLNVSARLREKPDQGFILKVGGRSFPYAVFLDEKGRKLAEFKPMSRLAMGLAEERALFKRSLMRAADQAADAKALRALQLFRAIQGEITIPDEQISELARDENIHPVLRERYLSYRAELRIREAFDKAQAAIRVQRAKIPEEERPQNEAARRRDRDEGRRQLALKLYPLLAENLSFRVENNPAMYLNYALLATQGAVEKKDKKTAQRGLDMVAKAEEGFVPDLILSREGTENSTTERARFRRRVGLKALKDLVKVLP